MKPLPFKMRQETPMEKYRAESFFFKEPETLEWIRSFDPYSVFFDVGANVGVYSLYAASLFPKLLTYAIEPMEENYKALLANYGMNDDMAGIITVKMAIGNRDGMCFFSARNHDAGASGGQVSGWDGEEIKISSIGNLVGWGWQSPNYVKIDIDGQELQVILGMRKTLPDIKSILVEVSKESKKDIMEILVFSGFTTDNRFNTMTPHSRERRAKEKIDAENIIFTRP